MAGTARAGKPGPELEKVELVDQDVSAVFRFEPAGKAEAAPGGQPVRALPGLAAKRRHIDVDDTRLTLATTQPARDRQPHPALRYTAPVLAQLGLPHDLPDQADRVHTAVSYCVCSVLCMAGAGRTRQSSPLAAA